MTPKPIDIHLWKPFTKKLNREELTSLYDYLQSRNIQNVVVKKGVKLLVVQGSPDDLRPLKKAEAIRDFSISALSLYEFNQSVTYMLFDSRSRLSTIPNYELGLVVNSVDIEIYDF